MLGANLKGNATEPKTPTPSSAPPDLPSSTPTTPSPRPKTTTPSTPSDSYPALGSLPTKTVSSVVLATCGPNSASFLFDKADSVNVGCHASMINMPPAAALK